MYKIISGGQTGADRAGLEAAKEYGLETGGWMPKGFIAQDGVHPEFVELYGIQEHESSKYPPRTALNVKDSDGTVRFMTNRFSAGSKCTLKMIKQYQKPYFDVHPLDESITPYKLADWIMINNIQVLNVAGNSERNSQHIGEFVVAFLHEVFECLSKQ